MTRHDQARHRFEVAHLSGLGGAYVEFSVDGYEFPKKTLDPDGFDHDANWLFVWFQVRDGRQTWAARDPAWLTTELPLLSDWLRTVAGGRSSEAWTALEPLLTLECSGTEPLTINARLALELRSDDVRMSDQWDQAIELRGSVEELNRAADAVDTGLRRFPIRLYNRPQPR